MILPIIALLALFAPAGPEGFAPSPTPTPVKTGYNNAWPQWSPDGRRIVFASTRDGATGAVTRLTEGVDVWAQASWSRDGRRLLFSAKREGVDEVYVVNADGTGLTRLTRGTEGSR